MIRINLLPPELRRGNRLSARIVAVSFAAAICASASIGWFGLVWFGDLSAAEQKLATVEGRLAEREKRAAYHTQLESNRKDYLERVQTIQAIGQSRRLWSKFLDELIDVVNNGNIDRHVAWFEGIQVKTDAKGTSISLPASVQGNESSRVANLHDDLEAAPFAADVLNKSDPSWRLDVQKERTPPMSLSFPLTLQLRPTGQDPASGKPGATNPPAAPPRK